MATALARIRVHPGMEARFEQIVTELHRATHAGEPAVRRYEYWRGAEPGSYYSLLSFDDFLGFVEHQTSEHHGAASPALHEVTESITLEWVDPVPTASSLAPTNVQPLPAGASALAASYHQRFAAIVQAWWLPLR